MKFHGKAGQELRTWILFFVGILLVFFFAWQKNPLNPWWTLIIGAFTCTAIIVSAVQMVVGGVTDVTRRTFEEARKRTEDGDDNRPEKPDAASLSISMGYRGISSFCLLRNRYAATV